MKKVKIVAALGPVAKVFDQLGILYYIGGSVYGKHRATQDVDVVTNLKSEQVNFLVEQLQSAYYID
ncbi:MAG: hypothetical protein ABFS56_35700 [Pseudomonadota bacterium]